MNLFDENPFSRDALPERPDAEQDSALQRLVFRVALVLIVCFGLFALFSRS
ncbi:MAG: hypothetical protein ACR2JA_19870 [Hydrogenophaga sp.]|uniref:hypothetical protein n=1 Tax=Hydrogenophaga sp. TaxID=1904254 RepID=UPI003D9B6864